jgi:hypothetical protein
MQDAITSYFPYLKIIFDKDPEMAANLALDFQLFDTEPGKRKLKLIWNGEIDYFAKNKSVNREIKKKIRELYPQLEKVTSRDVDSTLLEEIREDQEKQKKAAIEERKRLRLESNKSSSSPKSSTSKKRKKKSKKQSPKGKKKKSHSLSEFF